MFGRARADRDQINIFAVAGRWGEMDLVQERAAAHGNLGTQEGVLEERDHCPAQQKILLNLIRRAPRHRGLVGQNVLARDRRHILNSVELLRTCQRSMSGLLSGLATVGDRVTRVSLSGSQSPTTFASDLLPLASMINPNRCATAGSFSASSTRLSSRAPKSGRSGR